MSEWYYTQDGKTKIGPLTFAALQQHAASGALQPTHMVRQEGGDSRWVQAKAVPGLFPAASAQPVVAAPPQPPSVTPVQAAPQKSLIETVKAKSQELCEKFSGLPKNIRYTILGGGAGVLLMSCLCCGLGSFLGGSGDKGGNTPAGSRSNVKVTEYTPKGGRKELFSDEPVPILYGYSSEVLARMPADQKALIDATEKLVSETNQEIAQVAGNPVLLGRLKDNFHKKWSHLIPEKPGPLRGWIGQISLQPDGVVVTFGWRSKHNAYQKESVGRRMNAEYWDAPDTLLRASPHERFITIMLETKDMSNKAVEQFKGLKDGDWVSVDIVSAGFGSTSLLHLEDGGGQKPICVPGTVGIRDSLRFKRNRPLSEEPVVKKLP